MISNRLNELAAKLGDIETAEDALEAAAWAGALRAS